MFVKNAHSRDLRDSLLLKRSRKGVKTINRRGLIQLSDEPEGEKFVREYRVAASAVVLAGALALSGCQHSTFYAGVSVGPPAPLVGAPVGFAPGPGWVWTDGYYVWSGTSWVWRPGRWARPTHPGWVWRRPTYVRHRNGFRMYRGRWVRP